MSGNTTSIFQTNLQAHAIYRMVFGVVSTLLIGTYLEILSPQISAIFAVMLLGRGSSSLGLMKSLLAILVLFFLGLSGIFLGSIVQNFPLATILSLSLVIFWSFRLITIPESVRMLFLMLSILLPYLSLIAEPIAPLVLSDILLNLAIALGMVQLAFLFFPRNESQKEVAIEPKKINYNLDKTALNGLIVLLPVVLYFFYFLPSSMILTLAFIIVLALDPLINQSKKTLLILMTNLYGGLAAVIAYNLLTVVPDFFFYALVLLSAGMFFAHRIFSKDEAAKFYASAFRTFFLVLGVISSSNEAVEGKFLDRLVGITLAIIYVIFAYRLLYFINNPLNQDDESM